MAYKKADMIEQSLKAIRENDLVFMDEIISFVPFSEKTFYNHRLQELQDIKQALDHNRIKTKQGLRKNWRISKSPALQIALYKLLASKEEYERLIQQKIDHTTGGEKISLPYDIKIESRKKSHS